MQLFLLSETRSVSLKMKQNDSDTHKDIETNSKNRNKEEAVCFDPDFMYRLIIEETQHSEIWHACACH